MDNLLKDIRYSIRMLLRKPGFTAVAVLTLGLGIGVNTAFFTIVNAICLRGLPTRSPERVLTIGSRDVQGRPAGGLSYARGPITCTRYPSGSRRSGAPAISALSSFTPAAWSFLTATS